MQQYEIAASLRPRDDLIWLDLGTVRDELDDPQGALAALNEAVRTAPFYGHPRWQRGNVLFRMGRYDEAFADLRQAANSNHTLLPNLIDLAWSVSKGDPATTTTILQIGNDPMRVSYARFLAGKGKGAEALDQLQQAGSISDDIRNEIIGQLLGHKAYQDAYKLWRKSSTMDALNAGVFDGGFEGALSLDEKGFGWRVAHSNGGLSLSVDTTQRQSGSKSLLIQFNGNLDPSLPLVSQLVLVQPSDKYRLNFSSKTADLVAGGLPLIMITDAGTGQLLAKSQSFQGTTEWKTQSVDFATGAESGAVLVTLRREGCNSPSCPIFGRVWLDSFSLERTSPSTEKGSSLDPK
ncbi:MAG TPA: tetratricopeptide repeat protein [Pyrinomonadaceae bacterium]